MNTTFAMQICGNTVYWFSRYFQRMKATKCPSDEISLSNKVAVNSSDFPDDVEYVNHCHYTNYFAIYFAAINQMNVYIFPVDIFECQLDQVNILCSQSFERMNYQKIMLVFRWCNENGRPSQLTKTSMWKCFALIRPAPQNFWILSR